MDVVMIPVYNREACLTITLELLEKNILSRNMYYLFVADVGYRSGVRQIAMRWLQNHKGEFYQVDPVQVRSPIKQSYAVYKGYMRALTHNPNYVFMVEDDIFTSDQFFNWHYKILETTGTALSIATKQRNVPYPLIKNYDQYFTTPDYQSLGVCWTSNGLSKALAQFTPAYWANPFGYIKTVYPSVKQDFVASQDGLLRKYILANNIEVAWPVYPRAWHGGYYGANRGVKRATGTITEKIAKIKSVAFDEATLKAELIRNNAPAKFFYDSIPVDIVQPELVHPERTFLG